MSELWGDEVYGPVARVLYERCGLVFEGGQAHLFRRRIDRRALELHYATVAQYVAAFPSRGEGEFEFLIELLTVNETYFFREEDHFNVVVDSLWPEWTKGGERPIRVWSAACSTGCEAFTLALLLREKGLAGPGAAAVEIVGTDVSNRVLEVAKEGLYGEFSLRGLSPYYRRKYFTQEGDLFRLDPRVRELVAFRRLNLLGGQPAAESNRYQVIFCRNVLIYFDLEAKRKVVGRLVRALRPGGVLIVGRSETLFQIDEAPPLIHVGGSLVYRRPM